jgi:hypothetical protein
VKARRGAAANAGEVRDRMSRYLADRFAELYAASGLTDARPGSMTVQEVGDGSVFDVRVESRSRGAVSVGTIPALELARRFGRAADDYLHELAGTTSLRRGRPPGQTSIAGDEALCSTIAAMDHEHARITRKALAARAGYTVDELRGYLRSTNRALDELVEDCREAIPH